MSFKKFLVFYLLVVGVSVTVVLSVLSYHHTDVDRLVYIEIWKDGNMTVANETFVLIVYERYYLKTEVEKYRFTFERYRSLNFTEVLMWALHVSNTVCIRKDNYTLPKNVTVNGER